MENISMAWCLPSLLVLGLWSQQPERWSAWCTVSIREGVGDRQSDSPINLKYFIILSYSQLSWPPRIAGLFCSSARHCSNSMYLESGETSWLFFSGLTAVVNWLALTLARCHLVKLWHLWTKSWQDNSREQSSRARQAASTNARAVAAPEPP